MFDRLWVSAALLLPLAATADTSLTLPPVQDTSIYFGTAGATSLADGSGDYLWLGVTAEGLTRRMLIRFDLSAVPPGSVVRAVTLTLYESRSRGDYAVSMHRLLAPWGEGSSNAGGAGTGAPAAVGDATWVSRFHPASSWNQPGGDFDALPSASTLVGGANTVYSWTAARPASGPLPRLIQDVQDAVDAPGTHHGWIFIGGEGALQNAKRFESRDNSAVENRPKLTVVFGPPEAAGDVPLPLWSVALLGLGLAVAARLRRSGVGL